MGLRVWVECRILCFLARFKPQSPWGLSPSFMHSDVLMSWTMWYESTCSEAGRPDHHVVFQKRIRYKHCMAVSYVEVHLCNPNRNHWAEETGALRTSIALPGAGRRIWVAPCMVVFSAARMLSSTTITTCSVSTMLSALQMSSSRTNGRKECWRLWTFSMQTVSTSSNFGTFQCWSTLMNQWSRSFSKSLGSEFFLKVKFQDWFIPPTALDWFLFLLPFKRHFLSHWRQAAFIRKAQRWCLTVVFIARIPLTRTVSILNLHSLKFGQWLLDPTLHPKHLFVHFPLFQKMFSSTAPVFWQGPESCFGGPGGGAAVGRAGIASRLAGRCWWMMRYGWKCYINL